MNAMVPYLFVVVITLLLTEPAWSEWPSPATAHGYVAHLLVNEVPFPGERGYQSEANTMAAMEQLLMVLNRRLRAIPPGYTQQQLAAIRTDQILEIITVGGEKGQFDGFYRNAAGQPVMVPRVTERIANLQRIAGTGQPGTFARLLDHAAGLAAAYLAEDALPEDRHAGVRSAQNLPATGGGYSWMTDEMRFHPGGNFLRIADSDQGSLGGNRFFTLRRLEP
ncbi:MAG TPA: hypothetical protein PKE26_03585 [Kiritimatiellia bacterium]|nr:hypothetical protein [Kiritimatiellia bacterium]HMP97580.1 hypothetical protein [Kiritimatiellia bacterium]